MIPFGETFAAFQNMPFQIIVAELALAMRAFRSVNLIGPVRNPIGKLQNLMFEVFNRSHIGTFWLNVGIVYFFGDFNGILKLHAFGGPATSWEP